MVFVSGNLFANYEIFETVLWWVRLRTPSDSRSLEVFTEDQHNYCGFNNGMTLSGSSFTTFIKDKLLLIMLQKEIVFFFNTNIYGFI